MTVGRHIDVLLGLLTLAVVGTLVVGLAAQIVLDVLQDIEYWRWLRGRRHDGA